MPAVLVPWRTSILPSWPRIEQCLAELPRDREIVAYCRGPYCVFADEAALLLGRHGFRVRRFEDGLPEWRAAGLPVASSG
jgi:rhodanese-related sulfurtransferase